ncbi:MAG TPA: protein kinase [Thermoanaerobaculia bacterium]|nr:protein kinase [Thermoanaerobaculia bacterium]
MLQPDTLLGTYRLIDRLGVGGMGEVWKAEDTRLGRTVAIKILPHAIATDATAIARMKREARTAAQLYHPNIATIHAFEEVGDRLFIVMELVEGEPLSAVIRRGSIAEADVCRIGRSIADALAEAHEKGIVHRDIKPDNVIVNGPRVKVLDFGIAKQVEHENVGVNDPTSVLTQQGMIIGTVTYMSPEQALGKTLDTRTDLFSLGIVLYEAATGRLPFRGETATETIMHIVRDEAPMPQGISRGLAAIIHRCMRKQREERYASARELAQALEAQLAVAPTAPLSRKRVPAAAPTVITGPHAGTGFSPSARLKPGATFITVVVALVLAGAIGAFVVSRMRKAEPPAVVAAAAPAPVSAPAPMTTVSVTAPATIIEETTTTAAPPPPPAPVVTTAAAAPAPQPPARTADDHYNEGITRLIERQPRLAREAFKAAIAKDPHHAKAHFRLGEVALFARDGYTARQELTAALADGDRLDARERKLAELGLALLDRNRERAEELFREIAAISPRDPDLMRFREMLGGEHEDGPRPGQRPPFRRPRPRP